MIIFVLIALALLNIQLAIIGKRVFSDNRPKNGPGKCKVDTETGGLFIGRKYCSTHDVHWDPPETVCPGLAREMQEAEALPLAVAVPIPLREPDGRVREFVPTTITYGGGSLTNGITVELVDAASWEFDHRIGLR